ncbi:MAG: RNase H family protein [Chloroflexota bacterium]
MSITIYTDGSCYTQTRTGGYAAILQCGEHRREITGRAEDVTVNVMELTPTSIRDS